MLPRTKASKLSKKEKEQFFINLYIKAGAVSDSIPACEKRACLKPGDGKKILGRKKVKDFIETKMAPIRAEEVRLQGLSEAKEKAKIEMQDDLAKTVSTLRPLSVEAAIDQLMKGVIGLDWYMRPEAKQTAIDRVLILGGLLETTSMRQKAPVEPTASESGGVYTTLFQRLRLQASPEAEVPLKSLPDAEVFDLYPVPVSAQPVPVPAGTPLPQPGESIDEAVSAPKADPNVITVEIG